MTPVPTLPKPEVRWYPLRSHWCVNRTPLPHPLLAHFFGRLQCHVCTHTRIAGIKSPTRYRISPKRAAPVDFSSKGLHCCSLLSFWCYPKSLSFIKKKKEAKYSHQNIFFFLNITYALLLKINPHRISLIFFLIFNYSPNFYERKYIFHH